MPKVNINYSKTLIYKFVCKDLAIEKIYVGSTTDYRRRKTEHKYNCNTETCKKYNLKIYETIRGNGGWDNWDMVLIEYYPCNTSLEKRARERHWEEQLNASMNMRKPQNTNEDYYLQNKDKIDKYNKEYYNNNSEWFEKYRNENKNKMKEYAKKYREANKEKIQQKAKEYYLQNNLY